MAAATPQCRDAEGRYCANRGCQGDRSLTLRSQYIEGSKLVHIRPFRPGEERALHAVFHSAVHGLASKDYTAEQIRAWAPANPDQEAWAKRIQAIQPFVVEQDLAIIAYVGLQPTGYIDHFFVSAQWARRGVGTLLMEHLQAVAVARCMTRLSSDVSRTAQPFFARFGFKIVEQRAPVIRGIIVPNALMRKALGAHSSNRPPMR